MNIKKLLIFAPVAVLSLTSCNTVVRHKNSDYHIDLSWNTSKNFNILHLTDLHISNASDNKKHFDFIEETVKQARNKIKNGNANEDIDLITITGDLFIFAGRTEANEVFKFFDDLKINWALTFGNHDEQVYFPVDWLTSRLNELNEKRSKGESYCVFKDLQDDDVFGNANYVINLKDGGIIKEQLYFFDSNRYNFGEYRGYDYIHYDQIDWYERQLSEVSNDVKSLAFFHIPFPEFERNYQDALENKNGCSFREIEGKQYKDHDTGTGDPKVNTGLYDKMIQHGNTNGVFVGHNHTSNYVVDFKEGSTLKMTLGFGVKSTNQVYCEGDKLGGQIIQINKANASGIVDGSFDIKRVFHEYGE